MEFNSARQHKVTQKSTRQSTPLPESETKESPGIRGSHKSMRPAAGIYTPPGVLLDVTEEIRGEAEVPDSAFPEARTLSPSSLPQYSASSPGPLSPISARNVVRRNTSNDRTQLERNQSATRVYTTNSLFSRTLDLEQCARKRAGTLKKIQNSENNSELVGIALDEKFTLHVKRKLFRKLLEEAEKNHQPVAVVSFAGATHSGKSTLISTLISRAKASKEDIKSPAIGATGSIRPTTGNINVFDTENPRIFPNGILRLLDLEGSNASSQVPMDIQSRENFPPHCITKEQCTEFMNKRNEYVRKDFPRLAYLTSNIVVFLTQVDFANNSTIKDILEFSESTICGIQHSSPPFLIVIQNKVHVDDLYRYSDTEKFTQKWLETQDPESLLVKRFQGIRCFLLPYRSQRSKEEIEIFEKQMTLLEDIMMQQIQAHQAQIKKHHEVLLDNGRWLQILLHTVENLRNEDSTQFSEMVTLVENLGKEPKNKALMHFQKFYQDQGPSVKEATRKTIFFKHVEIATKTLVYCLVVNTNNKFTNNLKSSGKAVFDPGQLIKEYTNNKKKNAPPPPLVQNIMDTFERMWESQGVQARSELLKDVEGSLPCFKVHKETGKMCVLSLIEHEIVRTGVQHRTERVPVTQEQVQGWKEFQKIFANLLVTRVYIWEEGFENILTKDTYTNLAEKVYEQYRLMNTIELIFERSKQLQTSFEIACKKSDPTASICLLCMENVPQMKLDCNHKFCTPCLQTYEEAIKEKNLSRKCPLCTKIYKNKWNSLMVGIRDFSLEIENAKILSKLPTSSLDISNQLSLQDYHWKGKEHLASGEFSESYLVQTNNDNSYVCIKEFTLSDTISNEAFFRQIAILSSSNCPNIVKCLGVILEDYEHPKIVTEYCSKGDLKTYLHTEKKMEMNEFLLMAKDIATALDYLHSREVAHGQVSLSKVLIGYNEKGFNEYKLGDSYSARVSKTSNDILAYGKLLWSAFFFPNPYDVESQPYEEAKKNHPNIIQIIQTCEDNSKTMKDILAMLEAVPKVNSEQNEKHSCLVEIDAYKRHPTKDGIQRILKEPGLYTIPEAMVTIIKSKVKAEFLLGKNLSPDLFDDIEKFLQNSYSVNPVSQHYEAAVAVISVINHPLKLQKFCKGVQAVCTINNDSQIVELHKSEKFNTIYCRTGKVVADTIEWSTTTSTKLNSGENPAISMKSNRIVAVYEGGAIFKSIYCKIGTLQYPNIQWDSSTEITSGGTFPTVASIENGILVLYEQQQTIQFKIGQYSQVSMKMKFTEEEYVCAGKKPSLAVNNRQSVAMCFTSIEGDKMMIKTGKIVNAILQWIPAVEITEIGSNPRVALTEKKVACIFECQMSICLLLGEVDGLCSNIKWVHKYLLGHGLLPCISVENPTVLVTCEKDYGTYCALGVLVVSGMIKWFDS